MGACRRRESQGFGDETEIGSEYKWRGFERLGDLGDITRGLDQRPMCHEGDEESELRAEDESI